MIITYNIFVQAIGVIGIISSIISFQCKRHKPLMIFRTGNELFFALQYFLLGAYTGTAMNLIGCVRNVIFAEMVERKKSTVSMRFIFSGLFLLFSVFTWAGFKSILVAAAKVLSTFAYGSKNIAFVRVMILITSISWFTYNFIVRSYAGCVCEFLTICSIIAGIIRIDLKKTGECEVR